MSEKVYWKNVFSDHLGAENFIKKLSYLKIVLDLHEPVSGAVVTNTLSCQEHFSLEQEIIEMIEAKGFFQTKIDFMSEEKVETILM